MHILKNPIVTVVLLVGLGFCAIQLVDSYSTNFFLPGNNQGYEPVQPIAYSHRLHAGELEIPCLYCHSGAARSRHAGIPPLKTCMNCHAKVTAPFVDVRAEELRAEKEKRVPRGILSPELGKLYSALALGPDMKPDGRKRSTPVQWVRINRIPDFAFFSHSAHVSAGVTCQKCHGEVQTMERVRQVPDLTMGWCVNCHRESNIAGIDGRAVNAPTDCSACHY